jgi:outer membrane biosynthesis protein TonB
MALLAFPGSCKKKKPETPPPQAQAPTVTQPQQQPPPATQPPQTQPQPQESKPEQKPVQTQPATKPKPKPRTATTKKPPQPEMRRPTTPSTTTTTNKPATPQPTTPEGGQLISSLPGTDIARRRQETAQLLAVTDGELKGITRRLSSDEQNIVLQIKGYMQQSQAADKDGDLDRAHNLAVKAKLLADDLARPK